jgi:hypothetical protein
MKPMPPTPGRGGLAPRGILKTPLKATPCKAQERGGIGSPELTPLKAAPCQLTPLRRNYDRKVLAVPNYRYCSKFRARNILIRNRILGSVL